MLVLIGLETNLDDVIREVVVVGSPKLLADMEETVKST